MRMRGALFGFLSCAAAAVAIVVFSTAAPAETTLSPIQQLGKHLFFDKISEPESQSCDDCHTPAVGWTGAVPGINKHGAVYRGASPQRFGNRKPPTSAYATLSPVFHYDPVEEHFVGGMLWDGRATGEVLGNPAADQALGPFLVPVEQNNPDKRAVCMKVARSRYARLFEQVWGMGSLNCGPGVDLTYDRIALSIAAYENSPEVNQFSSRFDSYLVACMSAGNSMEACGLAEGPKAALDPQHILTDQEFEGLIEFGEYCSPCHISHEPGPTGTLPLFTDFTFDNIGVPKNPENPFYRMDEVFLDDGSPINPEGAAFIDLGLGGFLATRPEWAHLASGNDGKHKVPTLRNVDKRYGPGFPKAFMHNGVFKTLEEVVHFYNTRDVPGEGWPPPEVPQNVNRELLEGVPLGDLQLDAEAEAAIVAFLKTLSDTQPPRGPIKKNEPVDRRMDR